MTKHKIGKPDFCQNYPELNKAFEEELQSLCREEDEQTVNIRKAFENFKQFLTQAIYGTTECVDPRVRVLAQAGYGFGTKNWRFYYEDILENALEYAREKLSADEYEDVRAMKETFLGEDLIEQHCQDMLREFYGYDYKVYCSEFYRYFIRDMSLVEEAYFFTFANVAGWGVWFIVKLLIGIPWAILVFVLYVVFGGLERIYNILFKK